MLLLIGGEKGGTGKTTIATNLSAIKAINNKDVLYVDTDPQGTGSYWCSIRDEEKIKPRIPSIQKFGSNLKEELCSLSEKYSELIIDAGGRDSKELRSSMLVADIAVFPIRPSQFDLWTLKKLEDISADAKLFNPKLRSYILLNAVSSHPLISDKNEVMEYMEDFKHITLLNTDIKDRKSFRKAAMAGLSVVELLPEDPKATKEIDSLYKEIFCDEK